MEHYTNNAAAGQPTALNKVDDLMVTVHKNIMKDEGSYTANKETVIKKMINGLNNYLSNDKAEAFDPTAGEHTSEMVNKHAARKYYEIHKRKDPLLKESELDAKIKAESAKEFGEKNKIGLVQKATLELPEVHAQAALPEDVMREFIVIMNLNKPVTSKARIRTLRSMQARESIFDMTQRVLHLANSSGQGLEESKKSKPTLSHIELNVKEYQAEMDIHDDVLEDNIMRGTFSSLLIRQLAEGIGKDIEDLMINGDTASTTDPFLASLDGILKSLTSNVLDVSTANLDEDDYLTMQKLLPAKFRKDRRSLEYFISDMTELKLRGLLAGHGTSEMERELRNPVTQMLYGSNINAARYIDEDAPSSNLTSAFYMNPRNLLMGFWRNLKMTSDRNNSARTTTIVFTLRMDAKVVLEEAGVKAININSNPTT